MVEELVEGRRAEEGQPWHPEERHPLIVRVADAGE